MIQFTIFGTPVRRKGQTGKQHAIKLYGFRIYTTSTRSWGWVLYTVEVFDHRNRKRYEFTMKHPKKLEQEPWLPYQAMREFLTRVQSRKFKPYELEISNKEPTT